LSFASRQKRFVVDGEAVILGVDGVSDFNALHSGKHDDEVQLCASDILVEATTTCASSRCTFARQTLRRASSSIRLNAARSGRTCSGPLAA
jgi:hypothetical protein